MIKKGFLLITILLIQNLLFAQDIHILEKIDSLQSRGNGFYTRGLFPSQMGLVGGRKMYEDNNIFFTALTLYTLQSIKNQFSIKGKFLISNMSGCAKNLYPLYQNRQWGPTYNFYQTHPDRPFPGLKILSGMKKFRLADDLDDTSIIYLLLHTNDSLNAAVKKRMEAQAKSPKKVTSTFKKYRNYKAYRTWFAHKMKQDMDICVMSNALLFVIRKGLPLDSTDSCTITLIKKMVNENEIMKHGYIVSSHYQKSPVILYHLSRLISVANNPELNGLIPKIVTDLKYELKISKNAMDRVILISSLYRLHQKVDFSFSYNNLNKAMQSFYWFMANPFSGSNVTIKRIIGRKGLLNFEYKSEAYYWSLVLELQSLTGAKINYGSNFEETVMIKN
ncbi:MAG: hypothetical protein JXR65_01465 [Bacteroidales bacterium]|nr:hypothetical protein [Bacteroidales bacterium]